MQKGRQNVFSAETDQLISFQVVPTPVNHALALSTSVVVHPAYVTITDTKSDFRVNVRTSVTYVTLTHTTNEIMHVPFTLTTTEV